MTERGSICARCTDYHPMDGTAGPFAGRYLCKECAGKPVVFVAECVDCDWSYECEDREANYHHARVRVQQEGNSHETRKSFEDESHETVWRKVKP